MNMTSASNGPVSGARVTGLILGWVVLATTANAGAAGYEECNQILSQDIFNKITKNDSRSTASAAEAVATFFQQSDSQAYDAYSRAFEEAKKNGTKIDAEGHYGIIGGQVGIDLTSEKRVSSSEFSSKFNKSKQTYQSTNSSKTSNSQNLVNTYASYVRDPGTVSAWKDCVSRTRDTNLYAFSSRDQAGKTYVNVMWVPGALAGSVPSIPIGFVADGGKDGVKIQAKAEEQVAMGSGRNFAVTCGTKCDDGFQVTVNGTIRNSHGVATSSFTTTVDVPPLKPPGRPECSWEGEWDTEWTWGGDSKATAVVTITKDGDKLSGKSRYGHMVLLGKGNTVSGQWFNTTGTAGRNAQCQDGTVRYVKTGCSFEGMWNFCGEVPKFWWRGTKLQ